MGSPFTEHPFRPHRLPGLMLRLVFLAVVLLIYHHFTSRGVLSDAQWAALNVDGMALGTRVGGHSAYRHLDSEGRLRYVSGRELRLEGRVLLRVGDEITAGREILGHPKIVQDGSGTYYYYHRGHLCVGCALGPHERIAQISLQKGEKKQPEHQ